MRRKRFGAIVVKSAAEFCECFTWLYKDARKEGYASSSGCDNGVCAIVWNQAVIYTTRHVRLSHRIYIYEGVVTVKLREVAWEKRGVDH